LRPLDIHPDIRRATTLPAELYRDASWFECSKDAIFARAWHWIGSASDVAKPKHVRPFTLLPGVLDEPLALTRDEAGCLHCLSNACTHRGALVVEREGECAGLRCRYHGRRFALDGRFASMPEFEQAEGFPTEADDLARVPFGRFGELLFASPEPKLAFEAWTEPLRRRVGFLPLDEFRLDPSASCDYEVEAHWALYCDNFLEGFHIPFVHSGLVDKLDWTQYRTELFDNGNVQIGIAAGGEPAFELPPGHPDQGGRVAAWYFWLFPGTMLNFYPWGLSLNVVEPRSQHTTVVKFRSYVWREELRGQGAGVDLHRVEMEDEAVVASVQHGVRSRFWRGGRFSPTQERGVHHFHRLLASALNGDAA